MEKVQMNTAEQFGSVEHLSITILVDNKADLIVKSSETIKYFTDKPLLAEHGFSALLQFGSDDNRILWDAGVSRIALIENMQRMKIDPSKIKMIALSHGHLDHYAAMTNVLRQMNLRQMEKEWDETPTPADVERWKDEHRIPLVAHPAAFRERWWMKKDGSVVGPFDPPPKGEWEALGAKIVASEGPHRLRPGCWTTGYIPRKSFETSGRYKDSRYRQGDTFLPDDLEDDQAIVIHVENKGLVVLSGCAHSGIINTVNYAREISGVKRVWAILGGFHLSRANEEEIQLTVDAIEAFKPALIVPSHCTGMRAMCQFAKQMSDVFKEGVVGATYLF
jgi:7,8-dihydropterin-6-yl-methyl-4-(beta-D-ribofuranosyl)aminobenzene 5'-phosphate synthase